MNSAQQNLLNEWSLNIVAQQETGFTKFGANCWVTYNASLRHVVSLGDSRYLKTALSIIVIFARNQGIIKVNATSFLGGYSYSIGFLVQCDKSR